MSVSRLRIAATCQAESRTSGGRTDAPPHRNLPGIGRSAIGFHRQEALPLYISTYSGVDVYLFVVDAQISMTLWQSSALDSGLPLRKPYGFFLLGVRRVLSGLTVCPTLRHHHPQWRQLSVVACIRLELKYIKVDLQISIKPICSSAQLHRIWHAILEQKQ